MQRRSMSVPWVIGFGLLTLVALVVCVVATIRAGALAPVFAWAVPPGDFVATKQQFESAFRARVVGQAAAAATLVLAVVTVALAVRGRRRPAAG